MQLTKSQKFVCLKVKQKKNIFIEGVAGTGKTFLLKNLEQLTGKKVRLYATSGLASVNLEGYTISSNNGLKLGLYDLSKDQIKNLNDYKWDIETIIVIDEVGFLSEEQFEQIDFALRCRGNRNEFCGGFQIILAGDFRQMPHIGWGKSLEKSSFMDKFYKIELIENVRQKEDAPFFNILNKVRKNGFTNEILNFIEKNHNPKINEGIQIVATRQLMDELNNNLKPPKDTDVYEYECDLKHSDRLYDKIKLWEGMPVIITRNNTREGYYNGDTGIIVRIDENDDEVLVKLDRNKEEVWVSFVEENYETNEIEFFKFSKIEYKYVEYYDEDWGEWRKSRELFCFFKNKEGKIFDFNSFKIQKLKLSIESKKFQKVEICEKKYYDYMPILPANYLSIRRCQGLTLSNGILHESILNADLHNSKDRVNIQYVALSRFEKINQVNVKGFEKNKEKINNKKTILKIA